MGITFTTFNRKKYDLFISFRGEDVRRNFLSHMITALRNENIKFFFDDNDIVKGEEISESILKAIEGSKISLIIFSTNYASSTWCLDELEKIMEWRRSHRRTVVPVFYNIETDDVMNQTGSFRDPFERYQKKYLDENKVQRWRDSLREAASIAGLDSRSFRSDSELVQQIVRHVLEINRIRSNDRQNSNNNNNQSANARGAGHKRWYPNNQGYDGLTGTSRSISSIGERFREVLDMEEANRRNLDERRKEVVSIRDELQESVMRLRREMHNLFGTYNRN